MVEHLNRVQGNVRISWLNAPGGAVVAAEQHDRTGPAGEPDPLVDDAEGVEVADAASLGRQRQIDVRPRAGRVIAVHQHEAAIADRERGLAVRFHRPNRPAAGHVQASRRHLAVADCGTLAPRADERAVLRVRAIGRQPRPAEWPDDRQPTLAAVGGGERPAGVRAATVAGHEAGLIVEELHHVQPRQQAVGHFVPGEAAVGGGEQDAAAAEVAGQFGPPGDEPAVRREEVDAGQRGPRAGLLALPALPAVDAVPDDAVVAGRPALAVIDELHRP